MPRCFTVRGSLRSGRRAAAAFLALLTLPFLSVGTAFAQAGELNWPSKEFVRQRDVGLNYPCGVGRLCDIETFMERQHVCALRVLSGGAVVLQRTSIRSDQDACRMSVTRNRFGIASITKSIVSLLFGFVYQDPGFAPPADLGRSTAEELDAAGITYGGQATLRQLLQMSSGMDWSEDEVDSVLKVQVDENGDLAGSYRRIADSVRARLEGAQFQPPGQFHYSGFDTQLVGILTEQRLTADKGFVQGTLDEAMQKFLWERLPVTRPAEWNADFAGHPAAHCCAYTSVEDLATLGDWMIQQYNEGEDAAADWIRASVSDTVDTGWSCEFQGTRRTFQFGYQWWVPSDDPQDGFTGIGTEGQYLHVFPEQDVVIVQFGEKLASDADTCEAMLVHRLIADSLGKT